MKNYDFSTKDQSVVSAQSLILSQNQLQFPTKKPKQERMVKNKEVEDGDNKESVEKLIG